MSIAKMINCVNVKINKMMKIITNLVTMVVIYSDSMIKSFNFLTLEFPQKIFV